MFQKLLANLATTDLVKQWFFALVRKGVAVAIPVLIASGAMQPTQANDLLGAALFIAGLGWSWWHEHAVKLAIAAAAAQPVQPKT